jgi:hypothetical protein
MVCPPIAHDEHTFEHDSDSCPESWSDEGVEYKCMHKTHVFVDPRQYLLTSAFSTACIGVQACSTNSSSPTLCRPPSLLITIPGPLSSDPERLSGHCWSWRNGALQG